MSNPRLADHVFFLAGFGSEYSLQPIGRYLVDSGLSVVIADMLNGPPPPPPAKPTIFITSQHPSCSSAVFRHHWGKSPPFSHYVGPLEIMRHLQLSCSVFVPHDLEAPIRPDELTYIGAFDIYCAPNPAANPALKRSCRVIPVGWVRHNHFDDLSPAIKELAEAKGVFFLNQIGTVLRAGGAAFVRTNYAAIFAEKIPVKLPSWPGCSVLGEELRALGAMIIAVETPSTKLIAASRQIYVNAPGSVIAEAQHVGTPAILAGMAGQPDRSLVPSRGGPAAPTFDFDGLLAAISSHIEEPQ